MNESEVRLGPPLNSASSPVTESDANRVLQAHYGMTGTLDRLGGEHDDNFLVSGESGQFILKISDPAEDLEVVDFQTAALDHVERRDPSIAVPRSLSDANGNRQSYAQFSDGSRRLVRLTGFLPGTVAAGLDPDRDFHVSLGHMLAKLDLALADYSHPGATRVIPWDLQHALALRALLPGLADVQRRVLCERALDHFAEIAEDLSRQRAQVIHNDFNRHNLLCSEEGPKRLVGIIDFGDAVRAPLVQDVAIAIAHQMGAGGMDTEADAVETACTIVAAYSELLPLRRSEVELLFPLIVMRLAMVVLIAEWRAQKDIWNRAYILKNHPSALAGLRQLAAVPCQKATAAFLGVANLEPRHVDPV